MLKVGDKCSSGQLVSEILGESHKVCCYFTEDKHIRWEYYENKGQVPGEMMPAVSAFDCCLQKIKSIVPKDLQRPFFEHAAKSLFSALDVGNPDKIQSYFQDLNLILKSIQDAPVHYASAGFLCSIVLLAALLAVKGTVANPNYIACCNVAFLGVLGGLLSVMQRSSQLWSAPDATKAIIWLQGSSRALIGALFGLFSYLLVEAKFFAGFAADSSYALYAIAFLAGLSERLIPEASANLERKLKQRSANSN